MPINRLAVFSLFMISILTALTVTPAMAQSPQSIQGRDTTHRTCLRPDCPANTNCNTPSTGYPTFLDRQLQKLADLTARRFQLPQHVAYESPLESSYYFRPYQVSDIEKQQQFMGFFKNPYDNRVFESLYADQPTRESAGR